MFITDFRLTMYRNCRPVLKGELINPFYWFDGRK